MASADELVIEPVIVSSDRFLDIEPYVKFLFAENPQRWVRVLPWHFPQSATKEQEESFLRGVFSDREIRMQGGADGDGLGFRFLKQVWYCAAMWNADQRMHAVAEKWLKATANQACIADPEMQKYLLSPDAVPKTFFDAGEISLYGEEYLGYTINIIRCRLQFAAQPGYHGPVSPEVIPANEAPMTALEIGSQQAGPSVQEPRQMIAEEPGKQSAQSRVIPSSHRSSPSPTMPGLAHHGQTAVADQPSQLRIMSDGRPPPSEDKQPFSNRRRGSYSGKHTSISNGRQGLRLPSGSSDSRYPATQALLYSAPSPAVGQLNPYTGPTQGRSQSGGKYTSLLDPMPLPLQGHPFQGPQPPPPHGYGPQMTSPFQQHLQPAQLPMGGLSSYQYGHLPPGLANNAHYNPQQPFADSSGPLNTRSLGNEAPPGFDNVHSRGRQHRDSTVSRGGSLRGAKSRGRGGRNGNSFSQPGGNTVINAQTFSRQLSNDYGAPNHSHFQRSDNARRDIGWHSQLHDENHAPGAKYAGGDARLYDRNDDAAEGHRVLSTPQQTDSDGHPDTINQVQGGNHSQGRKIDDFCQSGCDRFQVGLECKTVRKVVIFGIPLEVEPSELEKYLHRQYGLSGFALSHGALSYGALSYGGPARRIAYVTLADAPSVKRVMEHKNNFWPDKGKLTVELAREHFDLDRRGRVASFRSYTVDATPFVPAAPPSRTSTQQTKYPSGTFRISRDSTNAQSGQATEEQSQLRRDPVAREGTSATSSQSSPKRKTKKKSKKNRVGRDNAEYFDESVNSIPKDLNISKRHSSSRQDSVTQGAIQKTDDNAPVKSNIGDELHLTNAAAECVLRIPSTVEPLTSTVDPEIVEVPRTDGSGAYIENAADVPHGQDADTATDVSVKKIENTGAAIEAGIASSSGTPIQKDEHVTGVTTSKGDDEQIDESFHTATDSPDPEKGQTPSRDLRSPSPLCSKPALSPDNDGPVSEPGADISKEVVADDDGAKIIPSEGGEPQKSVKKVPVPQIPKFRNVSIEIPPLPNIQAASKRGNDTNDTLHGEQSRSVSGSSEVPPPAFVTAPSTPAIPDQTKKARPKKASKKKGPEQTESLSVFKKQKKPKGKKTNNKNSVKGVNACLAKPDPTTATLGGPGQGTDEVQAPFSNAETTTSDTEPRSHRTTPNLWPFGGIFGKDHSQLSEASPNGQTALISAEETVPETTDQELITSADKPHNDDDSNTANSVDQHNDDDCNATNAVGQDEQDVQDPVGPVGLGIFCDQANKDEGQSKKKKKKPKKPKSKGKSAEESSQNVDVVDTCGLEGDQDEARMRVHHERAGTPTSSTVCSSARTKFQSLLDGIPSLTEGRQLNRKHKRVIGSKESSTARPNMNRTAVRVDSGDGKHRQQSARLIEEVSESNKDTKENPVVAQAIARMQQMDKQEQAKKKEKAAAT